MDDAHDSWDIAACRRTLRRNPGKAAAMAGYVYRVAGRPEARRAIEADGPDEARNGAVQYLASMLMADPGFASEGHWTVHVDDAEGRSLLHVIVATVTSANGTFGR